MSVKVNSDAMDKLLTELKRRKYFSPDFSFYRFYTTQLLFTFDHLRYGGFEHKEFLKDAVWLGRGCTTKDTYVMEEMITCTVSGTRRKTPIVYEESGDTSATIHGDVFLIAPEHLIALDDNFLTEGLLERVKVQAYMLDQNTIDAPKRIKNLFGKPYADMWTYFVDKEFFFEEERLSKVSDLKTPDSYGHAVATGGAIKSWDRPYFEYTNTDILNARIKKKEFGGPFGRTTKQDYQTLWGDDGENLAGWEGWMGEAEWQAKMNNPSYADYGYGE